MDPQYEKRLEAAVRRELDALGELEAPPELAGRILCAIHQPAAPLPWWRQSWVAWPGALRLASLAGLFAVFCGLCYAALLLVQGFAGWSQSSGWLAQMTTLGRVTERLAGTVVAVIGHPGPGFMFAAALLIFTVWTACLGLLTAYVRLVLRTVTN